MTKNPELRKKPVINAIIIKNNQDIETIIKNSQDRGSPNLPIIVCKKNTRGLCIDINMYILVKTIKSMKIMASKTISITDEVYEELQQIKQKNESFSQLFTRMIEMHKQNLEKSFGAWDLSDDEVREFWGIDKPRQGRKWKHQNIGEKA